MYGVARGGQGDGPQQGERRLQGTLQEAAHEAAQFDGDLTGLTP